MKILNIDITASILQCGMLSKPIKIERGCKQGDPFASYEFLLNMFFKKVKHKLQMVIHTPVFITRKLRNSISTRK